MSTHLDFATLDLMDALDLAILIESEAYDRYKMFVRQLGHRFEHDATSAFERMAEAEAKHGTELMARRKKLFGKVPMRISPDDLFDVEAPDVGSPRSNMNARQALEVALSAERKAHDFYDDALPYVTNDEVRELFTELRGEEVEHVRMVQAIIARLPPEASIEWEDDQDDLPML